MPRSLITFLGLSFLAAACALTGAKAASSDTEANTRYTFQKTEGGTLRMDRETGSVALCNKKGPAWICNDLKQVQQALNQQPSLLSEISRLATLNEKQADDLKAMGQKLEALSQRLAKLEDQQTGSTAMRDEEEHLSKPQKPAIPNEQGEDSAHFEEFMERSERLFRHFFGMVKEFKRDLADERA